MNKTQRLAAVLFVCLVCLLVRGAHGGVANNALPAAAVPLIAQTAPTSGLVGYWKFDESAGQIALDSSGSNLTGRLANGARFVPGLNGNAIALDGGNDYVNLGNPSRLRLTGSVTITAWINAKSFPPDDAAIVSKRSSSSGFQLDANVDQGRRLLGMAITDTSGNPVIRYGNTTLSTNTWYHVAGVYDAAARTMNVYLNGQLDNGFLNRTVPGAQRNSSRNVNIGRRPGTSGFGFSGLIDEVQILSRPLSQSEVQATMGSAPPADTTVPAITLNAPAAGALLEGSSVTVSASATDNVGVAGVQFQLDGVNLGSEDTTAPYSIVWNSTQTRDGLHTLRAVARDAAGNTAASPGTTVAVSNTSTIPALVRWGRIRPNPGTLTPIGVSVVEHHEQGVLISETGISAGSPVRSGRFFAEIDGGVTTGIAITNPGDAATTVAFYFTDAAGTDFGHGSLDLAAKHMTTAFLNEAPFNGPVPMQGTFSFSSSAPVAVAALRGVTNERNEFLITTMPITPTGVTLGGVLTAFPHIAHGGAWNAKIVLVNPLDAPISGALEFFTQGTSSTAGVAASVSIGGTNNSRFPYSIPARSMVRLALDQDQAQTQILSARVIPAAGSSAPKGIALLALQANGATVSEIAIQSGVGSRGFRTFAHTSGVFGQTGSIQTGLAVANPSSVPASVIFELVRADGTSTGLSKSISVPANGQIVHFINELFPTLAGGFKGVLRLTSPVPVHATGIRGRYNERSEFLGVTMPAWDEADAQGSSESIVPYIAGGVGYNTQLILFTGSPGVGGTGQLALLTPTGQVEGPTSMTPNP